MNEKQTAAMAAPVEPVTVRPTKKQKELLEFIAAFIAEHGYSPSYREIMAGLNYTSVATVALHVGNLIKRGHVRKRDHSARSLEVVQPAGEPAEMPLKTNEIKPGDEKWLVEKVENRLRDAEMAPLVAAEQLEDLYILVGALRVLGLEGAAHSFGARLAALKQKQGVT
jgi:repressor LexA